MSLDSKSPISKSNRVERYTARRYVASALLGAYLLLSPWLLGTTSDDMPGIMSAIAVGLCLLALAIMVLVKGRFRAAETIKLTLGGWLVAAPFALLVGSTTAARSSWIVGGADTSAH